MVEVTDFTANPTNYYFLIPNNATVGFATRIGRAHSIAVKKNAGTTSASLRIDLGNLVGTLRIN